MGGMEMEHRPLKNRGSGIRQPSSTVYVIVLAAACLASINNFFCYHEPSAIAKEFEEYYGIDTKQFGTLFTIYSAPNIVLVFFSGQVIDTYGIRTSSIFFSGLILLSMLVAAFTPAPNTGLLPATGVYWMLLLSRFLLGLGGESIYACVSTMISRWFSSTKQLNTAMAINQASVQLFGSAAAFFILPKLGSISGSQWVTVFVCVISLVANLVYNYYERIYEEYLVDVNEEKDAHQHLDEDKHIIKPSYQSIGTMEIDVEHSQNDIILQRHSFAHASAENASIWAQSYATLSKFPALFWLILLHISLVSPILYTFTAFGPMYLQETFASSLDTLEAANAISLLYMSIVAAPFTGMIIDYVGYRSWIQCFASFNIPFIFLLLIFDLANPNLCMIWMGLIFSITESNGMAMISLVVPTELTGTAFGILGCCISIALLVEPAAVGWIRQTTGSFTLSIWIFFALTLAGSIVSLYFIIFDRLRNNIVSSGQSRD
jgi:MFS family permease